MHAAYTFDVDDLRQVVGAADLVADVVVEDVSWSDEPPSRGTFRCRVVSVLKGDQQAAVSFAVMGLQSARDRIDGVETPVQDGAYLVALGVNADGSLVLQPGPHSPTAVPAAAEAAEHLRDQWRRAVQNQVPPRG